MNLSNALTLLCASTLLGSQLLVTVDAQDPTCPCWDAAGLAAHIDDELAAVGVSEPVTCLTYLHDGNIPAGYVAVQTDGMRDIGDPPRFNTEQYNSIKSSIVCLANPSTCMGATAHQGYCGMRSEPNNNGGAYDVASFGIAPEDLNIEQRWACYNILHEYCNPPSDDWHISEAVDVTATFSSGGGPEVDVRYEVKSDKVSSLESVISMTGLCGDASQDLSTFVVVSDFSGTDADTTASASDLSTYRLKIDINEQTINGSPLWTPDPTGVTDGLISFCVRLDLVEDLGGGDLVSVSFMETEIEIAVTLTDDFTIDTLTATQATVETEESVADIQYEVSAFRCDGAFNPVSTSLERNSELNVCIVSDSPDVIVSSVSAMSILQDQTNTGTAETIRDAITDGIPNSLTVADIQTDGRAVVTTRLTSELFDYTDDPPAPITLVGSVALAFTSGRRARVLEFATAVRSSQESLSDESALLSSVSAVAPRELQQEDAGIVPFTVQVDLVQPYTARGTSPAVQGTIIAASLVMLGGIAYLFRRQRLGGGGGGVNSTVNGKGTGYGDDGYNNDDCSDGKVIDETDYSDPTDGSA
mmetsp:Transcript_54178/g.131474  ORF Transcript_54178/g.131474 Transcript_54178/m.131474 type:complete len:586 (+) Transcript_54178:442-2199(+)